MLANNERRIRPSGLSNTSLSRGWRVLNRLRRTVLATTAATMLAVVSAVGQEAAPGAYRPPRTPDGKPDLNGIWQVLNTAAWDLQDHAAQSGIPAGQGVVEGNEIPYQ